MSPTTSVLVAHRSEEARARLGAALFDAGFDVLSAATGEETLRTTAGSNPTVVVAQLALARIPAPEIYVRLRATGLSVCPFIVLYDEPAELPQEPPEGALHFVPASVTPEQVVQMVRMLILSKALSGEFAGGLEAMHGDLSRVSFGELLEALQKHVFTGRLSFSVTPPGWLLLKEGEVVDAAWGPARGRKALNRLAGLPTGAFALVLEEPPAERTIDADLATLITEAVEERLGYDELVAELPPLESRPEIRVVPNFFSLEFSALERRTMSRAQQAATLSDVVDQIDALDVEVLRAAKRLRDEGILRLHPPAARLVVVTDSTADLQPTEARRLGVGLVAVSIVIDGVVFKDGIDLTPEDFSRKLKEARELPVTAPVTRGEFQEAFRHAVASGDVLAILSSSKLSKSYENATAAAAEGLADLRQVRQEVGASGEPVVLTLDTGQASGPLGMLVTLAARLVRRGLAVQEVATRVESMSRRLRTYLSVSTLDYLAHVGVVRPEKLKGRAILALEGGALKVVDRVETGSAQARLVELVGRGIDPETPVFATLVHASAPAEAAQLRPRLGDRFRIVELMERQMGPAVTCHVGPGAVGVGVLAPTDEELELLKLA